MKKFIWLWWVLPLLTFSQCKFTSNKAIRYNNKVIRYQKNINNEISSFFKVLEKSASSSADSAKVVPAYDALVKKVNNQLDSTRQLKPLEKDSTFKAAAVELFEFYQKIVQEDYARLVPLVMQKTVTQEEQNLIKSTMDRIKNEENKPYQKFKKAQLAFAKKFGFDKQISAQ
ncbi:hypothetical protein BKI52_18165 [marine bacterium AO1-C]|nr:hypothetical protein BKI52_18165 [marine bacterium AO1-C]